MKARDTASSDAASAETAGRGLEIEDRQRKAEVSQLQCLIVSASQSRRNMIANAAEDAGWMISVFPESTAALATFRREVFHFAMVDLDHRGTTPLGFRELVQILAGDSSRLLVGVCGHESDPEEEIWVRQLGIWLYLPGTTSATEVSLLCEQAKLVVDKHRPCTTKPKTK